MAGVAGMCSIRYKEQSHSIWLTVNKQGWNIGNGCVGFWKEQCKRSGCESEPSAWRLWLLGWCCWKCGTRMMLEFVDRADDSMGG